MYESFQLLIAAYNAGDHGAVVAMHDLFEENFSEWQEPLKGLAAFLAKTTSADSSGGVPMDPPIRVPNPKNPDNAVVGELVVVDGNIVRRCMPGQQPHGMLASLDPDELTYYSSGYFRSPPLLASGIDFTTSSEPGKAGVSQPGSPRPPIGRTLSQGVFLLDIDTPSA